MQLNLSDRQGHEQVFRFWRAIGEGIAMAFERSPNFEYRSDELGWLVRAGEPYIDFNCALVFPGPQADDRLRAAAAEFREHGLPFLICLVQESPELATTALRLRLTCAGPLPLMILPGPGPESAHAELEICPADSPDDFRGIADLSNSCFGLAADAIERVMPFDRPTNPRLHSLIARRQGTLVGSVTYSLQEAGTGVWSMMTRPHLRRQGVASAVMIEAIARIRRESSRPIFLVSTPDGKPLYDRLGFETIDVGSVWTGTV